MNKKQRGVPTSWNKFSTPIDVAALESLVGGPGVSISRVDGIEDNDSLGWVDGCGVIGALVGTMDGSVVGFGVGTV